MNIGDKVHKVRGTYLRPSFRNGVILDKAESMKGVRLYLVETLYSGAQLWREEREIAPGHVEDPREFRPEAPDNPVIGDVPPDRPPRPGWRSRP